MASSHICTCLAAALAFILTQPAPGFAQAAEGPHPTFAVASIKPTEGQPLNSGFRRAAPGALNATNVTVKMLIEFAWGVREDQISGGPGWIETDHYEVVAKPSDDASVNDAAVTRLRTQSLLADRFHLVLRRQTKDATVLALIVEKNGPKGLKASTAARPDFVSNGHHLTATGLSMASFARDFLASTLTRTVVDKTGINGAFDFALDWSPDDAPPDGNGKAGIASQPPLLVAIQEQLGLKLEQQKGTEEYLVVDRIEKPTGN
jgi:uncharacterized protein (TIGR03435 family)